MFPGPSALHYKIRLELYHDMCRLLNIQDITFCAPSAAGCYTAVSRNWTDCSVSCTGLYADVQFTEDRVLHPGNTMEAVLHLTAIGRLMVLINLIIIKSNTTSVMENTPTYKTTLRDRLSSILNGDFGES